jgi:hypothetical protein
VREAGLKHSNAIKANTITFGDSTGVAARGPAVSGKPLNSHRET